MKSNLKILSLFPDKGATRFKVSFDKTDPLTDNAKLISNFYKLLYYFYYFFILLLYYAKKILKLKLHIKRDSFLIKIQTALYKAVIYGTPIFQKSLQTRIDQKCDTYSLSHSDRIILGFRHRALLSNNRVSMPLLKNFEKGVFILFTLGFCMILISLGLFLILTLLMNGNIIIIFTSMACIVIGLFIIFLLKNVLWASHELMQRIDSHQ